MKNKLVFALALGFLGAFNSQLFTARAATLTVTNTADSGPASIPFTEIGAKATADYKGDAIGIHATADGARLNTAFQKLSGTVTRDGLRLNSTADQDGGLRLVASAIGRNGRCTPLPSTGDVTVGEKLVTFARPGLTEEYSVSADGLRQDFIVAERPAGAGDLRVELAVNGAQAEPALDGARLVLDGSGRKLAYNRLRVSDAKGKQLAATLEVISADRLAIQVTDSDAVYPVRIDPTFSDVNWLALGSGIGGQGLNGLNVYALAVSGTNLYAGGSFTTAGGVAATNIAQWNGTAWSALGSGMNGTVYALAVDGNNNLYAGGRFQTAGGVAATNIAKWNGSSWSGIGWSQGPGAIYALAFDSSSNLCIGGQFPYILTVSSNTANANNIAKWDGTTWSTIGAWVSSGGPVNGLGGTVTALAADTNGNLYAGGSFSTAASAVGSGFLSVNNIAKWNGTAWSALGGMNNVVLALAVDAFGQLYAGGLFTAPANYIARWNGTNWSAVGSGVNNSVRALAFDISGDLYAGGAFTSAGGVTANNIVEAQAAPALAVQQPAGTNLVNGASLGYGTLNSGSSSNLTFTIRNTGYLNLTLGAITTDGANPGDFTVNTNAMLTTLLLDGTTTFTVTFSPASIGARSAAIHLANNDTHNNPFNLNLMGTGNPQKIAVQQPAGTNLVNGATLGLGNVSVAGTNLTFAIQNAGGFNLTLGPITMDGANPGDFTVNTNAMLTTVLPGSNTTFTLKFASPTSGPRSAAIQIANNDSTANPFNLSLTGFGYYNQAQYDANNASGVGAVTNAPNTYGLYTAAQLQALNVSAPLLAKNATNGMFTLTIGVQRAAQLTNFAAFPMNGAGASTLIDGAGKLEFNFTSTNNAAFFRLQSQ